MKKLTLILVLSILPFLLTAQENINEDVDNDSKSIENKNRQSDILLMADCRLCPEITPVKILLKNGVICRGHIAIDPQEELGSKPERSLEVFQKIEILRLYLSLDNNIDLNLYMPHVLYDKVYIDIPYKDIAKIELLEKIDK